MNTEIIELNQDELGKQCIRKINNESWNVFVKPLKNGDFAVGILNKGKNSQNYELDFSKIGLTGNYEIRDLWLHQNVGKLSKWSGKVDAHETKVFRLKKN